MPYKVYDEIEVVKCALDNFGFVFLFLLLLFFLFCTLETKVGLGTQITKAVEPAHKEPLL